MRAKLGPLEAYYNSNLVPNFFAAPSTKRRHSRRDTGRDTWVIG